MYILVNTKSTFKFFQPEGGKYYNPYSGLLVLDGVINRNFFELFPPVMYDESRDLISSGFSDGKAFPAESAADHNSSIQKRLRNLG